MEPVPALRVALVGSDAGYRAALRDQLVRDGLSACGEAEDAVGARRLALDTRPDVCVIADMPPLDGVAAAAMLVQAAPDVRVMLVGPDTSDAHLLAAVAAGALGYLSSDAGPTPLSAALLDAASGRSAFPRRLEALLIAGLHRRHS